MGVPHVGREQVGTVHRTALYVPAVLKEAASPQSGVQLLLKMNQKSHTLALVHADSWSHALHN